MRHNVLGVLSAAENTLDYDVSQETETILVLGARGHAAQDHSPHHLLVQTLPSEISEHQAPIAEPVALRALLGGVARNGGCDRVEVLPLLPRKVEIRKDDPVFEKGDARHPKGDVQPTLEELTCHIGDGVL